MVQSAPVSGEWASSFDIPVREVQEPKPPSVPPVPPKLNVVLPFIESDLERVTRLLKWIPELSGQLKRTLYLAPFKGLDVHDITKLANQAFADVRVIPDGEGVLSDWKRDDKVRDAAGPNSLFRQVAWYFYLHRGLGPWLYMEPDCTPTNAKWDTSLESEYNECGKPFMGVKMNGTNGDEYLNGAAIYPANAVQLAPSIATRTMWQQHPELEVAFDIAGSKEILPKAHITNQIQLSYRYKGFGNLRDAEELIRPETVLFHGDITGSYIKLLTGGDATCAASVEAETGATITTIGAPVTNEAPTQQSSAAPTFKPKRAAKKSSSEGREEAKPAADLNHTAGPKDSVGSNPAPRETSSNGHFETLGDRIRSHVNALCELENGQQSRKTRILFELRRVKLIPQARKQR